MHIWTSRGGYSEAVSCLLKPDNREYEWNHVRWPELCPVVVQMMGRWWRRCRSSKTTGTQRSSFWRNWPSSRWHSSVKQVLILLLIQGQKHGTFHRKLHAFLSTLWRFSQSLQPPTQDTLEQETFELHSPAEVVEECKVIWAGSLYVHTSPCVLRGYTANWPNANYTATVWTNSPKRKADTRTHISQDPLCLQTDQEDEQRDDQNRKSRFLCFCF